MGDDIELDVEADDEFGQFDEVDAEFDVEFGQFEDADAVFDNEFGQSDEVGEDHVVRYGNLGEKEADDIRCSGSGHPGGGEDGCGGSVSPTLYRGRHANAAVLIRRSPHAGSSERHSGRAPLGALDATE